MRNMLARRSDAAFYLVGGYFLLCVIVRLLRPDALEIDESTQAFLSQYFLVGYGSQPPFYGWLQHGLAEFFGISVATLSILKNSLLFLCCLFYGLAARQVASNRATPATAMLGVLTLPPVFFLAQKDLSHTVAALFAVSLFLFGFLRTLKAPSFGSYLITGIAVGIGVISKYNFVVVPIAAVLAILPEAALRKRIFDWRILLAVLAAVIIAAPHAYWLLHNLGNASNNTLAEMKEGGPSRHIPTFLLGTLSLTSATIQAIAPTVAVFALIFYRDIKTIARAQSEWTRVLGRMLIACFTLVLLVVIGVGATHIREKWLSLLIVLLPLYLAMKVDASGNAVELKLPRFAAVVAALVLIALAVLSGRAIVGPMLGYYSRVNTPYHAFADAILAEHGEPARILTTDGNTAGNLRTQFPNVLVEAPGGLATSELSQPLLVVWRVEGEYGEELPDRVATFLKKRDIALDGITPQYLAIPYSPDNAEKHVRFAYFWIAANQ
ncbi:glycosyltransferase [Rhizobium sp. AC44/96]|uniref:ArnT family glycosyltransferase n=1 Tax=Rhizobium sp. AC44/96 TaxID=1841654 RepID=UPI00080FFFCA|nr:glycosyltransferase family 39 protein [Rhizobium sp. AC44/96]OCJ18131.1 glycosyltransferase [Rhizobium sp. AC44/96]